MSFIRLGCGGPCGICVMSISNTSANRCSCDFNVCDDGIWAPMKKRVLCRHP